jgi:hypothetical protein
MRCHRHEISSANIQPNAKKIDNQVVNFIKDSRKKG